MSSPKERRISFLKYVLIYIICFLAYGLYHSRVIISSDTTTTLPMAADIINGNLFLKDWILGTNNFYFTETIFYALGLLFSISYSKLITWIPGAFYAFLVAGGLYIWKNDEEMGKEKKISKIAVLLMFSTLAVIPHQVSYTLLNSNSHNNLYAFLVLEIIILLSYLKNRRTMLLILYSVIALLISFSESVTNMVLFAPIGLLCLSCFRPKEKETWIYGKILGASIISYAGSKALLKLVEHFGGLVTLGMPIALAHPSIWLGRAVSWAKEFFLFGGYKFGSQQPLALPVKIILAFYILLFAAFAFTMIWGTLFFKRMTVTERIFYFIVIVNISLCVITNVPIFHRYIFPGYFFGLLLTFKCFGEMLKTLNLKLVTPISNAAHIGIALFCCLIVTVRVQEGIAQPVKGWNEEDVAAVLSDEKYQSGYGDFWCASLNSYYTGFKVPIYPIKANMDEGIVPYHELVKREWYEEKEKHFIITYTKDGSSFIKNETLFQIIGEPDETVDCEPYLIYYWEKDISKYIQTR